MTLEELQKRALELRELFAQFEVHEGSVSWNTSQIMEGFVVDVGDLMRLVMAKQNYRKVDELDKKLAHELADCLWSVLVLANKLDVDLETAFVETTATLEQAIKKKLAE